jgi:hypothetical protein
MFERKKNKKEFINFISFEEMLERKAKGNS